MKFRVCIITLVALSIHLYHGNARADTDLFVEAEELKAIMEVGGVVVLDARNKKSYNEGYLKGAINVWWEDLTNTSSKRTEPGYGTLLSMERLSKILGGIGIEKSSRVVVYADSKDGWGEDGFVVWMLRLVGVKDSKMLNGGIQAWTKKRYPLTKTFPIPIPKPFAISVLDSTLNAETEWIEKNKESIKIIDSRTMKEYEGAKLYGEARGGHLPEATLFPFKSLLKANGKLKSDRDLDKMFVDAGLKKSDSIVAYCTGGIRSAYMILVLRMLGYKNARNYDASFWGWAAEIRLPVE